jgi:hypothetical protein
MRQVAERVRDVRGLELQNSANFPFSACATCNDDHAVYWIHSGAAKRKFAKVRAGSTTVFSHLLHLIARSIGQSSAVISNSRAKLRNN